MYLLKMLLQVLLITAPDAPRLEPVSYVTLDTSKYISYRLYVMSIDTTLEIHSITPSCGCVLASVQKSKVRTGQPAEIYVAINTEQLDSLQPVTIDIQTEPAVVPPLRAYVYKFSPTK